MRNDLDEVPEDIRPLLKTLGGGDAGDHLLRGREDDVPGFCGEALA